MKNKILKILDKVINTIFKLIFLIILLFSMYSLWDSIWVYNTSLPYTLKKYKPSISLVEDTEVYSDNSELEELYSLNKDILGWISIDNTNIDYPFLKGKDNSEYLNKNIYGKYAISGSIFMDSNNSLDDNYIILYGHNMKNGGMFGNINKYINKEYFDSHLNGTIFIKNIVYKINILGVMKVDQNDSNIYNLNNSNTSVINYLKKNSIYHVELKSNISKLIVLSTCTSGTNKRMILIGELTRVE